MHSIHRRWTPLLLCAAAFYVPLHAVAAEPAGAQPAAGTLPTGRVVDGLLASYTFEGHENGVIRDRSGVGEPLDLRIDKPQAAVFQSARMTLQSSVKIVSDRPARKVTAAVKASGALTVELWLRSTQSRQTGPARIVSLSVDTSRRNFTLGQDQDRLDLRLRRTTTDLNGMPSTPGPAGSLAGRPPGSPPGPLEHWVVTRTADGTVRFYRDGKSVEEAQATGDPSNWDESFPLTVANEATGDRPWLGELALVALYGRALTAEEVERNRRAGPPREASVEERLPPPFDGRVDFVRQVQPILRRHCYECHAADQEDGGVNLGIRRRALEGGDHGPILIPGDAAGSRLMRLVAAVDPQKKMPPEGEGPTRDEIGVLRAWIDQGAVWPPGVDAADPREVRARSHWAFQPLRRVELPAVRAAEWPKTPVDAFLLARLEAVGGKPQPPAEPRALVRRLAFDLTGLPPTPDEVERFVEDSSRDADRAVDALVDRLLESPRYGERWGRHWLDVARYADSDGQESDRDRPTAYRYRDFVIRSFNDDRPFDEFVRWQLAGDEYAPHDAQAIAATGFLAAGPFAALPDRLMEDERLRNRYNELDDVLSTIGTGLLGLTLGCARCHDHKYDAIPARDYYGLLSAWHGGERAELPLPDGGTALGYRDRGAEPAVTWLFQRGDFYDRDQPVSLGFLSLLTSDKSPADYWQEARRAVGERPTSGQRRAVADWIGDVEQGAGALLARVAVNRVWQQHFGQGLVRTVGDFGARSDPPSHPELLEWLARDFVEHGWRMKRLHRLIVRSAAYRQRGAPAPASFDPDDRLLSRAPLRRLEGEALRDAMLAVAGTLNLDAYGPAVKPPIPKEAMLARNLKDGYPDAIADGPAVRRRSVYLFHKRVVPYPLLQAFDKPDAQQSCSRRDRTTVAPQALALMNDPFVRTVAGEWADRLLRERPASDAERVDLAYNLALARPPTAEERAEAVEFLSEQRRERQARQADTPAATVDRLALADFCQVLFSLNEFLYVD